MISISKLFDLRIWPLFKLRYYSLPRFVIYDYSGRDGRKVRNWVIHFGPVELIN